MPRVPIPLLFALLLFTSCHLRSVSTTPIRGEVPSSVIVLPLRNSSGQPLVDLAALASGADQAVRARGYRVLPLQVGFDLVRDHGFGVGIEPDRAVMHRVFLATGVDAVLLIDVESWSVGGRPLETAAWSILWRLISTKGNGELWSHREEGEWARRAAPTLDPTLAADSEPDVLPIGTLRDRDYRSAVELVGVLHRTAMARLPELK